MLARVAAAGRIATVRRSARAMTTVVCVRKGEDVAVVGDGQVSLGSTVVKPNAQKVRRIRDGSVLAGFAGSTADAIVLMERLEQKIEQYPNQLMRSCVELAKGWRTDKYLRRLDAVLVVADSSGAFTLTGNGDVLEPYEGVIGIGSGGDFARAAALALLDHPDMTALDIAEKAIGIAASIDIYTNDSTISECISGKDADEDGE